MQRLSLSATSYIRGEPLKGPVEEPDQSRHFTLPALNASLITNTGSNLMYLGVTRYFISSCVEE